MTSQVPDQPSREPFAARLHFIPRLLRGLHKAILRVLRGYFEHAPGWVLLTTRGRRTGLARETLLPCARTADAVIVISTYGWRSDWIKNLRKDPCVAVTWAGRALPATAEVVEGVDRKRALVSDHPFFPVAPFAPVQRLLGPLLVPFLRRWVMPRPIVVLHCSPDDASGARQRG